MQPETPVLPHNRFVPQWVYAKDQPQYLPLPAIIGEWPDQRVTTRWKLSWAERLEVFLSGTLWVQQLTFGEHLQPIKLLVDEPTLQEVD